MKKICKGCHKGFYGRNKEIRCKVCQKDYRRKGSGRQSRYWKASERSFGDANHAYYAMVKEFTKDELAALVSINKKKLNYEKDYRSIKEIKSCIRICTELYKLKSQDDFSEMIEGQAEDLERKILLEQIGVQNW